MATFGPPFKEKNKPFSINCNLAQKLGGMKNKSH